jgi:hypothetical protein
VATVLNIITDALQELGVIGAGEPVNADDAALCLSALNTLIDAWHLEPLTIFASQQITATLPANTTSLTIGPTLNINVARPVRLEDGCFVRVGDIDYPLDVVSQVDYNAIALKGLDGPWPRVCMYNDTHPTGAVFFWPRGACEVHLNLQLPVAQFAATTTTFSMPPGYRRALALTLAEEVARKFNVEPHPMTTQKARAARRMLKRANFTMPQLDVGGDPPLPGRYAILAG